MALACPYDRETFPRTQIVYFLAWRKWIDRDGVLVPDLTPMHVSTLMSTPRAAFDHAFDSVFELKLNDEKYTGPCSVADTFFAMRDALSEQAHKDLNKVFTTVYKKYWTVVFEDPDDRANFYVGYTTAAIGKRIFDIYDGKVPEGYTQHDFGQKSTEDLSGAMRSDTSSLYRTLSAEQSQCAIDGEPDPDIVDDESQVTWGYYCSSANAAARRCKYGREAIGSKGVCVHAVHNEGSTHDRTRYICICEEAQAAVLKDNAQYVTEQEG